jgi:capsular polysaccharide biosynthesis protein
MQSVSNAVVSSPGYDPERSLYRGAVYQNGQLITQSLRPNFGVWRFDDEESVQTAIDGLQSAIYIGRFFYHFGHFLIETLPSLGWADDGEVILAHPWPETIDWQVMTVPWVALSLEALGIDRKQVRLVHRPVLVDELRIAPQNLIVGGHVSLPAASVYGRIRDLAAEKGDATTGERVYFSRRKFSGISRPILNEDAIERLFMGHGFSIVYPETLPFDEQIRTAANAKIIAGIDGSALHLGCFMRGGHCMVVNTRGHTPAIEVLNSMAGVKTDWIDGLKSVNGAGAITIDETGLREALRAKTWL